MKYKHFIIPNTLQLSMHSPNIKEITPTTSITPLLVSIYTTVFQILN